MSKKQKIRRLLHKYQRKSPIIVAKIGDYSGNLEVPNRPGYIYARFPGGDVIEVFNDTAPVSLDTEVVIGREQQSSILKVIGTRGGTGRYGDGNSRKHVTMKHALSHQWLAADGGNDPVFIELRQFLPFRSTPIGGMYLHVYRGISWLDGHWQYASGSTLDFSPYVPPIGSAEYALVYIDTDGLPNFVINSGAIVSETSLSLLDIPKPYPGTLPISAVRLYGGMTGISETRQTTDLIDLRFPLWHDHKFIELSDTPNFYSGSAGFIPFVTASEDELDFLPFSSGSYGYQIRDNGNPVPRRNWINFVGATITDNSLEDEVIIAMSGSSGGGGSSTFVGLSDTPANYSGASGLFVAVNDTEDGLIFVSGSTSSNNDADAIHVNVSGEISAITEKPSPENADIIVIEDSSDSYNKKKVQIANLPSGGSGSGSGVYFDRMFSADIPPTSPDSMDDEFSGSSLDSKWTLIYGGATPSYQVSDGLLYFYCPAESFSPKILAQPAPSGDFEFTASMQMAQMADTQYPAIGLFFSNTMDTSGYLYSFIYFQQAPRWNIGVYNYTYTSDVSTIINPIYLEATICIYLRIQQSGTMWNFYRSLDGQFYTLLGAITRPWLPASIGMIFKSHNNTYPMSAIVKWFRRTG